MKSSTIISG